VISVCLFSNSSSTSLIVGVSSYNKSKTDLNETILQSAKDNISILDTIRLGIINIAINAIDNFVLSFICPNLSFILNTREVASV
jgi:hypothetical protein